MKTLIKLSLLMLALVTPAPVSAFDFMSGGIYYDISNQSDKTVMVTYRDDNYNSYSGNIIIPTTVNHEGTIYSVTAIGKNAFTFSYSLKSIDIPNTVTTICNKAFSGCTGLTSAIIPNSVTSIGGQAFQGCIQLSSVTIPNSVTAIGERAFYDCSGLTSITVDNNNPKYDSRDNCNAIIETATNTLIVGCNNTIIPNSITSIGRYAFISCTGLTSITIPNSVTSIGSTAFGYCVGLSSATIGNSVKTIEDSAFYHCTALTSITIPNSVTSIGSRAFEYCVGLSSVTIGNSVKTITGNAFYHCTALDTLNFNATSFDDFYLTNSIGLDIPNPFAGLDISTVNFGDDVKRIPAYFTKGLDKLKTITIGRSVTSLGYHALHCESLETLNFNAINCADDPEDPSSGLRNYYFPNVTVINIGEGVRRIPACLAIDATKLTQIHIPSSIKTIGRGAFQECRALSVVHINDLEAWCRITFDSDSWFTYTSHPLCYAWGNGKLLLNGMELTDLTIPNTITKINDFTFMNSGLSGILTIPNSVTSIGSKAFYRCSGLSSVTFGDSVKTIGDEAFCLCTGLTGGLIIPNSVKTICENAFSCCSGLTSVTIGNAVTTIGYGAFSACIRLTDLTIGKSVTSIGNLAFASCDSLRYVTCLAETPPSIHNETFSGINVYCYPTLTVPYKCGQVYVYSAWNIFRTIKEKSYFEVNGIYYVIKSSKKATVISGNPDLCIGNVVIPSSVTYLDNTYNVTTINSSAFEGFVGITNITIPNSVRTIGARAFYNCIGLTGDLNIPEKITTIGDSAFQGCTALNTLNYDAANCSDFNSDYTAHPFYNLHFQTINIGETVDKIPAYFSSGLTELTHVAFGNNVTAIGNSAFSNCSGITGNLNIPNSVTAIGKAAFYNCAGVTSVTIGNAVTTIGDNAFFNCTAIEKVDCKGTVPPVMQNTNCFSSDTYEKAVLYVPKGLINAYRSTNYWNKFENIMSEISVEMFDVNGDGNVNISDINILIDIILGRHVDGQTYGRSDVNHDGVVNIADINTIINTILYL